MTATLLIFDLDGTLVTTRAGRRAFTRAFERVFGLTDAAAHVTMAGRTDPAIYREICGAHGIDPTTFDRWKAVFLEELARELEQEPGHLHAGVMHLLEACSQEPNLGLALGTGNVEEGARLKLGHHDLNRFFPTGGFGGDGENRDEVIARAIERAGRHYGREFGRLVVIGDTPLDVACGKANRCWTVGVATGHHRAEELAASGADLVMDDFADGARVFSWLKSLGHGV